jgi:hypothetical protein
MTIGDKTVMIDRWIAIRVHRLPLFLNAEKKLRACQNRVRTLTAELVATAERKRHRLAQDLHDTVAQCLAGCRSKLETLTLDPKLRVLLRTIRELLHNVVRHSRAKHATISISSAYIQNAYSIFCQLIQTGWPLSSLICNSSFPPLIFVAIKKGVSSTITLDPVTVTLTPGFKSFS